MALVTLNYPTGGVSGFSDSLGNSYSPNASNQIQVNPDLVNMNDFFNAGFTFAVDISAGTAGRPTSVAPGAMYFDTTIGKPVWRNGANTGWVDATGTAA
jgi:hypothetical protein